MAAGLLDEAVDLAEPEAGALSDGFCREEGLEDAIEHICRRCPLPVSVIASFTYVAGLDIARVASVLIDLDIACGDDEVAAAVHRIAGIDRDVQDGVVQLIEIGIGRPEIGNDIK